MIANSSGGGDCVNNGLIATNLSNLIEDGGCDAEFSGDPLLGPLADNGGPTQTHALLPGSPAIDAGDNAACPETDQRGVLRDAFCDLGAYEFVSARALHSPAIRISPHPGARAIPSR